MYKIFFIKVLNLDNVNYVNFCNGQYSDIRLRQRAAVSRVNSLFLLSSDQTNWPHIVKWLYCLGKFTRVLTKTNCICLEENGPRLTWYVAWGRMRINWWQSQYYSVNLRDGHDSDRKKYFFTDNLMIPPELVLLCQLKFYLWDSKHF